MDSPWCLGVCIRGVVESFCIPRHNARLQARDPAQTPVTDRHCSLIDMRDVVGRTVIDVVVGH
jgi:hypothetical protein